MSAVADQIARAQATAQALRYVDRILVHWQHAEEALNLAWRLARHPLGPAEAERRLHAWAAERGAEGGVDRPITTAENKLLTVSRALRGEP